MRSQCTPLASLAWKARISSSVRPPAHADGFRGKPAVIAATAAQVRVCGVCAQHARKQENAASTLIRPSCSADARIDLLHACTEPAAPSSARDSTLAVVVH